MKTSTIATLGAALLCLIFVQAQDPGCTCPTHDKVKCDSSSGSCVCTLGIGPANQIVNCSKLIPKCWLMKRESLGSKEGRRLKPAAALIDNDGLYNPDCENDGTFKARQCNGTSTCWCVNSAGVRRTDKGDTNWKCAELVRTGVVLIEMKRNTTANADKVEKEEFDAALRNLIATRYNLPAKYIGKIEFDEGYSYVYLNQNTSVKAPGEVDVADVGYYIEKDIKGDPIMSGSKFDINFNGKSFAVQEPLIMYIDEKPHEISMKRLTAGVIAVIVVVVVAIVAGIVVLVLTRRKRGRYEKAEMKEMNEMQQELKS